MKAKTNSTAYIEQNVEPCRFCGSLNIRFFRNQFGGSMMAECECGAIVSFKMADQSPRAFFQRWNGSKNNPVKKTVQ